jgi:hypothetical protein
MILSNPHSPPRYVFAAAAGLLRCCLEMLLRSWLKLKFTIWCLINTNHIFLYVNPRPKLRLVGLQFLKSNYSLLFMRFLLSLSSLTLFPYFPNGSKTFLFLTQIVHNTVNWQINLAIDLQTLIFHLPQTVPLSHHYITCRMFFWGMETEVENFTKHTCLSIQNTSWDCSCINGIT